MYTYMCVYILYFSGWNSGSDGKFGAGDIVAHWWNLASMSKTLGLTFKKYICNFARYFFSYDLCQLTLSQESAVNLTALSAECVCQTLKSVLIGLRI